jgi:hypothetical protein
MLQMILWHRKNFFLHSLTKNHANDDVINNVLVLDETSIATTHKQPNQGETLTTIFYIIIERKKIYVLQNIKSIFYCSLMNNRFVTLCFFSLHVAKVVSHK